ncbi:MAG TPA: hypothetical protein DFS52_15645 [Myxococcales bacterium]|nr:hypothetical protein [Myxococcales bacterium]
MKSLAWSLVLALFAASAEAAERVYTPEGWYQLEDEGEPAGADTEPLAVIIVHEGENVTLLQQQLPPDQPPQPPPPAPPQPQPAPPEPQQGDSLQAEIERFRQPDCDYVRGRYLQRVMELHGLNLALDPKALAALTYTLPPMAGGNICFGQVGCLPAPALAPLYGLPPVPPGALSYDLELKTLFTKLLTCLQQQQRAGGQPSPGPQQLGQQAQPQPQPQQQRPSAQPQSMPNSL